METKTEKFFEKTERKEERLKTPAPAPDLKPGRSVVIAAIPFTDTSTGKSFKAGDVVEGWDENRVAHYLKRGVVYRTTEVAPKEVK